MFNTVNLVIKATTKYQHHLSGKTIGYRCVSQGNGSTVAVFLMLSNFFLNIYVYIHMFSTAFNHSQRSFLLHRVITLQVSGCECSSMAAICGAAISFPLQDSEKIAEEDGERAQRQGLEKKAVCCTRLLYT